MNEIQSVTPVAAWWRPGTLVLRFVPELGDDIYVGGLWTTDHGRNGDYHHVFAGLEYLDDDWPDGLPARRQFESIPVLPALR